MPHIGSWKLPEASFHSPLEPQTSWGLLSPLKLFHMLGTESRFADPSGCTLEAQHWSLSPSNLDSIHFKRGSSKCLHPRSSAPALVLGLRIHPHLVGTSILALSILLKNLILIANIEVKYHYGNFKYERCSFLPGIWSLVGHLGFKPGSDLVPKTTPSSTMQNCRKALQADVSLSPPHSNS